MTLLEREPELEALQGALGEVAHGEGRVALVHGEAGIGKTSLVDCFARTGTRRGRTLWGVCDSLDTPRPLGPIHDIAQQAGSGLLGRLEVGTPSLVIFSAVLEELRHRPPVIAVLEDLHWADVATLDLIKFLGHRIRQVPALLVLTYRDDELGPHHPLRILLGDLATSRRIPLSPLSVAAVRTLAAGQPLDAAALHHQTGGNPFFVTEALASREAGIPVTVRDAVVARAARLSPSARAALDAAAIIGTLVEPWLLTAPVGDAAIATEECVAVGMPKAQGDLLAFRHELARQAILDTMAPPRRRALHELALQALASPPTGSPDLARLADHAERVSGPQGGAMGIHYVNGDLVGDGKLDPQRPEALMYEPKNGKLQLVGVEYIVIAADWDATSKTPPALMGQLFHYNSSPNRYGIPAFYSLHVWAWRSNPHRTFVDWNPKVSCEGHTAGAATQTSSAHGARH